MRNFLTGPVAVSQLQRIGDSIVVWAAVLFLFWGKSKAKVLAKSQQRTGGVGSLEKGGFGFN